MTRSLARLGLLVALVTTGCSSEGNAARTATSSATSKDAASETEIRAAIDRYVKAVNDGDDALVGDLWVQPEQVSYVNPMQRLRSPGELQGFWGFLKTAYSKRQLTLSNIAIQSAGDVGWVVFDWDFNATQADGKPSQSHGWETQVYRKTDRGWRMVHGHYSAAVPPPPTGAPAQP